MNTPLLELRGVRFAYESARPVLSEIHFSIDANERVGLIGANGGGKSTLAKLIMGIEKPTSGQILFDGKDITDWDITRRAQAGISFAFQQPVRFKGIVPDLFKEGSGVVAEGKRGADGTFVADNLLAKHDEKYVPREMKDMTAAQARQTVEETK